MDFPIKDGDFPVRYVKWPDQRVYLPTKLGDF